MKTKNLFALMALGSALTLVGCGDDDNGPSNPTGDGGVDAGETSTGSSSSTGAGSTSSSETPVESDAGETGTGTEPVLVDAGGDSAVPDGGDVSTDPVLVDSGTDAEAPVSTEGDAGGDAEAPATSEPVDSTLPAPTADAGDAG